MAAFGIGRTLAHDLVERRLGGEPRFRALSEAVNRKGWRIVALARLTPVFPFSVGNYGFGLTRMRAWDYFFASMLGTLPSNAVYVYLGAATGGLLAGSDRARTPAEWALLALGLAATVVLTVMLRRMADRALAEARLQPAPSRSR